MSKYIYVFLVAMDFYNIWNMMIEQYRIILSDIYQDRIILPDIYQDRIILSDIYQDEDLVNNIAEAVKEYSIDSKKNKAYNPFFKEIYDRSLEQNGDE